MSVKVGDVVKFRSAGRVVNALVLAVRNGEVSHRGANDEPLLTLALVDPEREKRIAPKKNLRVLLPETTQAQVFIEYDVVHHSHEFDQEFLQKHGDSSAQIAAQRGYGEWLTFAEYELEAIVETPAQPEVPEPPEVPAPEALESEVPESDDASTAETSE